jgi:hypothetical protein
MNYLLKSCINCCLQSQLKLFVTRTHVRIGRSAPYGWLVMAGYGWLWLVLDTVPSQSTHSNSFLHTTNLGLLLSEDDLLLYLPFYLLQMESF